MKKLLSFVALAFLTMFFLAVRQKKQDIWHDFHFERKVAVAPLQGVVLPIGALPSYAFDKIQLYNEEVVLYSSTAKLVRVYSPAVTLQNEAALPSSSVTVVSGQVLDRSLYLLDYRRHLFKISLDSPAVHRLASQQNDLGKIKCERAVFLDDSTVLVKQAAPSDAKNHVFAVYNSKTGKLRHAFPVLPKANDYGFNSDGIFVRDDQHIYFKCYLNSQTYCFNAQGMFTGAFSEINHVNKDYAVNVSGGGITFSEPTKSLVVTATVSEGNLYVHSLIAADNDEPETDYVDLYSTKGTYLKSLALRKPTDGEPIRDFVKKGNAFFVLRRGRVEVYTIPSTSPSVTVRRKYPKLVCQGASIRS